MLGRLRLNVHSVTHHMPLKSKSERFVLGVALEESVESTGQCNEDGVWMSSMELAVDSGYSQADLTLKSNERAQVVGKGALNFNDVNSTQVYDRTVPLYTDTGRKAASVLVQVQFAARAGDASLTQFDAFIKSATSFLSDGGGESEDGEDGDGGGGGGDDEVLNDSVASVGRVGDMSSRSVMSNMSSMSNTSSRSSSVRVAVVDDSTATADLGGSPALESTPQGSVWASSSSSSSRREDSYGERRWDGVDGSDVGTRRSLSRSFGGLGDETGRTLSRSSSRGSTPGGGHRTGSGGLMGMSSPSSPSLSSAGVFGTPQGEVAGESVGLMESTLKADFNVLRSTRNFNKFVLWSQVAFGAIEWVHGLLTWKNALNTCALYVCVLLGCLYPQFLPALVPLGLVMRVTSHYLREYHSEPSEYVTLSLHDQQEMSPVEVFENGVTQEEKKQALRNIQNSMAVYTQLMQSLMHFDHFILGWHNRKLSSRVLQWALVASGCMLAVCWVVPLRFQVLFWFTLLLLRTNTPVYRTLSMAYRHSLRGTNTRKLMVRRDTVGRSLIHKHNPEVESQDLRNHEDDDESRVYHGEEIEVQLDYVYEQERWWVGAGWNDKLVGNDPPHWCDMEHRAQTREEVGLPGEEWEWTTLWAVDYTRSDGRSVDANGWEYANNYGKEWHGAPTSSDYRRRRRWVRARKRVVTEEIRERIRAAEENSLRRRHQQQEGRGVGSMGIEAMGALLDGLGGGLGIGRAGESVGSGGRVEALKKEE